MRETRFEFSTKFRKQYMKTHPYCEVCRILPATELHHIVPVCKGGKPDPDNAAALCHFCHKYVPEDNMFNEDDEAFEQYKSLGGMLWALFQEGYKTRAMEEHTPPGILEIYDRRLIVHREYIKSKPKVIKEFRKIKLKTERAFAYGLGD